MIFVANSLPLFAQNADTALSPEEIQWIAENPVIRVSNPSAIAPFISNNNGDAEGFAIDYVKLLASKVGLQIEIPPEGTWDDMMDKLRNGEIDIVHSTAYSDERAEFMTFTDTYLDMPLVNASPIGVGQINNKKDLIGKKVGLVKGFIITESYKTLFPDLEYVEFDTIKEALFALSTSQIDVYSGNLVTIKYSILQFFIPNISITGETTYLPSNNIDHRLAALKENQILIDILSKAMRMVSSREFVAISEKWQAASVLTDSNKITLTTEEEQWIDLNPRVTVANPTDIEPFSFIQNGTTQGIAVDYLNLISEKTGLEFQFAEPETWDGLLQSYSEGKFQLLHSANRDEERDAISSFTLPYLTMPMVNFGRNGASPANSIEDLKGRKLGVVTNYVITKKYKEQYPDYTYVEMPLDL